MSVLGRRLAQHNLQPSLAQKWVKSGVPHWQEMAQKWVQSEFRIDREKIGPATSLPPFLSNDEEGAIFDPVF